jgi:hypothetical protein
LRVKTGGILANFEDLKRGTNNMKLTRLWRVGPKGIFEIASNMTGNNHGKKDIRGGRTYFTAGLFYHPGAAYIRKC